MTRVAFIQPLLTRRPIETEWLAGQSEAATESRVGRISAPHASVGAAPRNRFAVVAPYLLALSVLVRFGVTYLVPNGTNFIDLHVYVDGAATMDHGGLYDFVYHPAIPPIPLQFTYPPFAGLVFYPLHFLPFPVVALCWQLGVVAALYGGAAIALKLLKQPDPRGAMAWTALAIWFEPARHLFELGQVGALLMVAVLWAVSSRRWWVSGVLLGVATGMKLTPAVAGLYFVGARRWMTVALSAVVFVGTVVSSIAVAGAQARFYFTDLLGDADRVGEVGKATNQSLRGVLALTTGSDAGYGPLLVVAIVVTAVLSALAWRRIGAEDPLGRIVVVMLFGLLLSPISWTHHWAWVLPLIMWLMLGPMREQTRVLGWVWMALVYLGPPWLVALADENGWITGRHWYTVVFGSSYVLATVGTLAYVAFVSRRAR